MHACTYGPVAAGWAGAFGLRQAIDPVDCDGWASTCLSCLLSHVSYLPGGEGVVLEAESP